MGPNDRMPTGEAMPSSDTEAGMRPVFKRALVAIEDASQAEHVAELARRAGATQARVLHLKLRDSYGGRRYAIETDAAASRTVEAAVLDFRMAGIEATGAVRYALIDRAAEAIVADATEWGADVIVLGASRRSELATRLFGSVTLRVLQHATCPVLVAASADRDRHGSADHSAASVAAPAPAVRHRATTSA